MDEREFIERASGMERRLYRTCAAILPNDADCADAVQEALIKAWRARESLRHSEYFETWLTRIVINECKLLARKNRPTAALDESIRAPDPPDTALWEALNSLDEALRLPVILYYINGFDVESASRILRIPSGTVKSRLHRARMKLRKLLDEGDEP